MSRIPNRYIFIYSERTLKTIRVCSVSKIGECPLVARHMRRCRRRGFQTEAARREMFEEAESAEIFVI